MNAIWLVLISVLLGAVGQVGIKWGTSHVTITGQEATLELLVKYFSSIYVFSGLILYAISAIFWVFALTKIELSCAYPMVSFGYVVVFAFSYFLLGEKISLMRLIGLFIICIGILIIARSK